MGLQEKRESLRFRLVPLVAGSSTCILGAEVDHESSRRPEKSYPLPVGRSYLLGRLGNQGNHQLEMSVPVNNVDGWDGLIIVITKMNRVDPHQVIHSEAFSWRSASARGIGKTI